MSDTPSPLARALGRMPCGLYIVSTEKDGAPLGFLGSFLTQTGFEPPTLCVAVGKGRAALEAIRESGGFTVSILDADSRGLMKPFLKPPEGGSPFDEVATTTAPSGRAVLEESLAWLDCKLAGEHATPDHVVVFGEVQAGDVLHEGDPSIHLRKNGLGY